MAVSQEKVYTVQEFREAVLLNEEGTLLKMHYDKKGENENIWYLDNGASNHMTGHHEKFQELDEAVTGRVRFGDESTVEIMGKGTVVSVCKNGEHRALQEVYYIPKLCSNIISLGQMTEDGNKVLMEGDTMKVFDRSRKLLMSAERTQNRLYKVNLKIIKPVCLLESIEDLACNEELQEEYSGVAPATAPYTAIPSLAKPVVHAEAS